MLRGFILAYLLVPGDFLVWGIVWSAVALLQESFDTGVMHALIHSPHGDKKNYLDTAWWINAGRNVCLTAVIVIGAPFIARDVYRKDELCSLLQFVSLVLVFDGLTSLGPLMLRKQLLFKRIAAMEVTANALGFAVAISVAYRYGGALAMVLGEVAVSASRCVLSYVVHPYRPGLQCRRAAARALLGYGLVAYLVALVNALAARADVLLLGRFASDTVGGCYVLAMTLVMAPCGVFGLLSVTVGFPALSLVQHDLAAVRRGTAQIIKGGLLVATPIFALLAMLSYDVVKLLPDKYAQVGQALCWLSVFGISVVFVRQVSPALYAIRRAHWCVARGLLNFVLIAALITPMYHRWGMVGACWATNAAIMTGNLFLWMVLLKELRWPWRRCLADLAMFWWALIGGALAFVASYLCFHLAGYGWRDHTIVRCLICGAGLVGYSIACYRYYRTGERGDVPVVPEPYPAAE